MRLDGLTAILMIGPGACYWEVPSSSPVQSVTPTSGPLAGPIQLVASISVDGNVIKEMEVSVANSGAPSTLRITTTDGLAVGIVARRVASSFVDGSVLSVELEGTGGATTHFLLSDIQLREGAALDAGGASVLLASPASAELMISNGSGPSRPILYCRCDCNEIIKTCCAQSPIECCACNAPGCCP